MSHSITPEEHPGRRDPYRWPSKETATRSVSSQVARRAPVELDRDHELLRDSHSRALGEHEFFRPAMRKREDKRAQLIRLAPRNQPDSSAGNERSLGITSSPASRIVRVIID